MSLMPKRTKFRKVHRGRMKGEATRGHRVAFGDFGLQSMDYAWLPAKTVGPAPQPVTEHVMIAP